METRGESMLPVSTWIMTSLESWGDEKNIHISLGGLNVTPDLISEGSVSLEQGLSSKDNYSIGNTICSEFKFSLINTKNKYTDSSFYDQPVVVTLTMHTKEGRDLTMDCGQYICQRPTIKNTGRIDIRAYDEMIKFEKSSEECLNSITYPISLVDFMRRLCAYAGVKSDIREDITNGTFMIKQRPESQKLTLRDLMGMALTIAGGNGRINIVRNTFEVAYVENSGYTIPDGVHISTVEIENFPTATIDCVVASNSQNEDIVYGNKNGFVYYIDNNELLYGWTDEEIVNMLSGVLYRLRNIVYRPFKLGIKRGLIFLQPGDIVSFTYNNRTYTAPILERRLIGLYREDSLSATGTEDRDRLRDRQVSSGQVSEMISGAYGNYNLVTTTRYLNKSGTEIIAMGMKHSNLEKELIFKPVIFEGQYLGMQTNFQDGIENTDKFGEEPDMKRIDKEEAKSPYRPTPEEEE